MSLESKAKEAGLDAAKRMSGFSVDSLDRWIRDTWECECSLHATTICDVVMDGNGAFQPVPGNESTLLTLEISTPFGIVVHEMQAEILRHLRVVNGSARPLGCKGYANGDRLTMNLSYYLFNTVAV